MRVSNFPQRSEEWFSERLGVPSASNFHRIITPTGKPSSQSDSYINELVAERITGQKTFVKVTDAMQRGADLEQEAREYFEFISGIDAKEIGFCKHNTLEIGCSPDGVIDAENSLLEIKCPIQTTMVEYLRDDILPAKYIPQVQGQLWITECDYAYFFAYHPDMKSLVVRVERDEKYIKALADLAEKASEQVAILTEELKR
jgi:putative phage-type endonuclease